MVKFLVTIALLFSANIFAQSYSISKIVVDQNTKQPLPYVDIYNSKNYVTTNTEGKFEMLTQIDSLYFNLLGYQSLKGRLSEFEKASDTIYLKPQEAALEEVHLKDIYEWMDVAFETFRKELHTNPFTHRFFLRATERRNGEIVTLVDIVGKANFKLDEKKENHKAHELLDVEVEHQRSYGVKTHMFHKQSMPKLFQCLWSPFSINFYGPDKTFEDSGLIYGDVKEIKFETKDSIQDRMHFKGHFHIDLENERLVEYKKASTSKTYEVIPFQRFLNYKFRQVISNRHNIYTVNDKSGKVYPKSGTFKYGFEALKKKKALETFDFDIQIIFIDPFIQDNVSKNIKSTTYLTDIDFPYNASFWEKQQLLKLTTEQQNFISRIRAKDDFGYSRNKIISNE